LAHGDAIFPEINLVRLRVAINHVVRAGVVVLQGFDHVHDLPNGASGVQRCGFRRSRRRARRGYVRVLSIEAEQQIAAGPLQPMLEEWNPGLQPVVMVHARGRVASDEISAFRAFVTSVEFLTRKWRRDYRLIKELWTFADNRIAVRFAYESRDDAGNWFRSYGNENCERAASCSAVTPASTICPSRRASASSVGRKAGVRTITLGLSVLDL
jgi:nuclear transport factor 2 (NTF2) superfamily protein